MSISLLLTRLDGRKPKLAATAVAPVVLFASSSLSVSEDANSSEYWSLLLSDVSFLPDNTPNPPALPESQKEFITVQNFHIMRTGDISSLQEIESRHFLMAGDEGAVVTEYGTFHDNDGLRFTNPDASL